MSCEGIVCQSREFLRGEKLSDQIKKQHPESAKERVGARARKTSLILAVFGANVQKGCL